MEIANFIPACSQLLEPDLARRTLQAAWQSENFHADRRDVPALRVTGFERSSPAAVRWRKANAWEIRTADLTTCGGPYQRFPLHACFPLKRHVTLRAWVHHTFGRCVCDENADNAHFGMAWRPMPASPKLSRRRRLAERIGDFHSSRERRSA